MSKRLAVVITLILSYGALVGHNMVPHVHAEESTTKHEHQDHHHHSHDSSDDESPLSQLLADVVHLPGSTDSFTNHLTTNDYKVSASFDVEFVDAISLAPPFVPPAQYSSSFREESIPSFSVSNASLRAPPVA